MLKKVFLIVILLLMIAGIASADTGTYIIKEQIVNLDIQKDGNVRITYDIEMEVTGGNIPWVTVGLPNKNFDIKSSGGAVNKIKSQSGGGWHGVRIDLDKTYYSNDIFQFNFDVIQKGFIYKLDENNASVQFTPCWWDNANIEHLQVSMIIPDNIPDGGVRYSSNTPDPSSYVGRTIIWEENNLAKGAQRTYEIVMPADAFTNLQSSSSGDGSGFPIFLLLFIVIIFIIIAGVLVMHSASSSSSSSYSKRSYTSPTISTSGYKRRVRHINMDCPNDRTRLNKRTIKGTTIDFCDKCGGIYFDRGEIESLIKDDVNEDEFNINKMQDFSSDHIDIIKCIRCDSKIKKITKTVDSDQLSIFVCEDCDGLWLNKGSYQKIKDERIKQQKLQQKKFTISTSSSRVRNDYYGTSWWIFYPYIFIPRPYRYIPPRKSTSSTTSRSSSSSCACVSCACVVSCAACCACAGGGAAGCAPKNKYPQITFDDYAKKK